MRVVFVQIRVGGGDRQFAAPRHCVPRIDCEVHDDLFNLPLICFYRPRAGSQHCSQLYVFANEPVEHFFQLGNHGVQLQQRRLQYLFAAEGEELAGQSSGAGAGLLDFFDVFS